MKKQLLTVFCVVGFTLSSGVVLADESDQAFLKKVCATPAVSARQQKNHQIAAVIESVDSGKAVHVYHTCFDQPAAYIFSLGWFVGTDEKGVCVDEFGQEIPLPGEKPKQKDFDKGDLHAIHGFDLVSQGRLDKAGKEFEAAIKESPTSARNHNNLGVYYALTNEADKAKDEFDTAVKINSKSAILYCNRAWFERFCHKPEEASEDLKQAFSLQSDLTSALLLAGKLYLDAGKSDDALQIAQKSFDKSGNIVFWVLSGDANVSKGDLKQAKQSYQKALLSIPDDAEVLLKQAQVMQSLGDTDGALKLARSATEAAPGDAAAHMALGHLLEANSDFKAAQLQYERVLEIDPPLTVKKAVYGPLLRVLLGSKQPELADKYSKQWAKENADDADCHYNRAWCLSQLQDIAKYTDAIQEYRQALKLNAKLVQTHYNLGLLLANTGHSDQATSELQIFIEKSPNDPDVPNARKLLDKLGH